MTMLDGVQTSNPRGTVLISGGGSGGHVFPGLAVAAELESRGWAVSWAGARGGMEDRLVTERGVDFHALAARPVVGRNALGKVRAMVVLLRSALTARSLVRRLGARLVVGTGGYVSVPAVLGGRLATRPALLVEPNAEPGLANRWLSRLASAAAVAYPSTAEHLRCPAEVCGVPVRASFFEVAEELPEGPPRLLVLGGSQGAQQLNELVPAAVAALAQRGVELTVLHQAGRGKDAATLEAYRQHGIEDRVEVEAFLDDVAGAMAASHLVISRAGAITLAEICAAGRPAVLVPLAIAAGGHQVANAERLQAAGAALALGPATATAEHLTEQLADLLGDSSRLRQMALAARSLGRADAAQRIADQAEKLGGAD
nr:UDP-N-acetylglucosamine--N-acetylmuramyl-(pentapeptide) pyrophosphoryl-undecaprenol N-acetylglucosamine transferase-like [Nerophis lumbriciformis]